MDTLIFPVECAVHDMDGKPLPSDVLDVDAMVDALVWSVQDAGQKHSVETECARPTPGATGQPTCVVTLRGPRANVGATHQRILLRQQRQHSATIRANLHELYGSSTAIKAEVKSKLNEIMMASQTEILVRLGDPTAVTRVLTPVDTVGELMIEIRGGYGSVWQAKHELLFYLDTLMGLHGDYLEVPAKHVPIIAGRHQQNVDRVMDDTSCNVYLPCFFNQTPGTEVVRVYVTGPKADAVSRAKSSLQKLANDAQSSSPKSLRMRMNFQKLLTLLCNERKALSEVMFEHGTYLEAVEMSTLVVHGQRDAAISHAVKRIVDLCGTLVMKHVRFSVDMTATLPLGRLLDMCRQSHCSIRYTGSTIDAFGTMAGIMTTLNMVKDAPDMQQSIGDVTVFVEMSSEYKDFITGKKNGKMNKIIKSAGVGLIFNDELAHALVVNISSQYCFRVIDALTQLRDELPAESEFFIPDQHHKRIIGVGGKNIQAIMKQYGVYVKFIGNDEFRPLGGITPADKNVLCRTPSKNQNNLRDLYLAIMDQVDTAERESVDMTCDVPRRYQWLLRSPNGQRSRLEEQHRVKMTVPRADRGDERVTVHGPVKNVQSAFQAVRQLVPETYALAVVSHAAAKECFEGGDFQQYTAKTKEAFSLAVSAVPPTSDSPTMHIHFTGNQNSARSVDTAAAPLLIMLKERKVAVRSRFTGNDEEVAANTTDSKDSVRSNESAVVSDLVLVRGYSSFNHPDKPRGAEAQIQMAQSQSVPVLTEAVAKASLSPLGTEFIPEPKNIATPPSRMRRETENLLLRQAVGANGSAARPFPGLNLMARSHGALPSMGQQTQAGSFYGSTAGSVVSSAVPSPRRAILNAPPTLTIDTNATTESPDGQNSFLNSVVSQVLPASGDDNRLASLLDAIQLSKYKSTLADNDVDFETFLTLTEDDLKELEIPLGARKRMLAAAADAKRQRRMESFSARPASPNLNASAPESRFGMFSAPVTGPRAANPLRGPPGFVPSALSPSKAVGFVDFLPDSTPLGSPLGMSLTLNSPKKTFMDSPRQFSVEPKSAGAIPSIPTFPLSSSGSLEPSNGDMRAPGANRPKRTGT